MVTRAGAAGKRSCSGKGRDVDRTHSESSVVQQGVLRREDIVLLRDLDFGPKTTITEGSVALVNGQYYIIGIPACQFEFEGKHFVAMSPDAPFYQELMDKNENDSFVFNNKQFTIESIF